MMEQQSIPVHGQQSDIFIMFSVIIIIMMYSELCVLLHVLWILKKIFYKPRDQKVKNKSSFTCREISVFELFHSTITEM